MTEPSSQSLPESLSTTSSEPLPEEPLGRRPAVTPAASLEFEVTARSGSARAGRLRTAHGEIETPAFMPVGTLGAVKGLGPDNLKDAGAQVMLSNLYHLSVMAGIDRIETLGGVHAFSGWSGPILTDSGGYQVFSLSTLRKVDRGGVTFRSHHDGSLYRFTPESVVEMQERLGVDIAMMLDECPPWPVTRRVAERSLARTQSWAEQARSVWRGGDTALFGIVQGSFFPELRERAARDLVELDFPGYAIGGVSVGEGTELGREVVASVTPILPEERPRYLMGLGRPIDILRAVEQGVDLFDCVLPSRNARHGLLFTRSGPLRIKNARFRDDPRPIDPDDPRGNQLGISRAFLHHLFRSGEVTAKVLATRHNLLFYLDFMRDLRQSLMSGSFADHASVLAARLESQES